MSEEENAGMEGEYVSDHITLDYDDGSSERFEVIGVFECGDREYIALAPESDEESVYLYGYVEHEDESFELVDIEDDDEFAAAAEAYESSMADEGE